MKALEFYRTVICKFRPSQVRSHAIVGGYARDMYYGFKPKDMDICVVPCNSFATKMDLLSKCSELGLPTKYYEGYESTDVKQFREMLHGVLKVTCEDMQVDILISNLPDVQSYVDAFDYNLNQYTISPDGTPLYVGLPDLNPEYCMLLLNLRNDTLPERKHKMETKWIEVLKSLRS